MKTLSRTGPFIVLPFIAIVATLAFRAFSAATPTPMPTCPPAFPYPMKIVKEIGGPGPNNYAELKKTQTDFDNALNTLEKNGGQYCIRFLPSGPHPTPEEPYKPHHHLASIKTDKVTKSEVARTTATDASAANDPNAVYRITSNSATDIQNVLDTLITPTPSPTPSL
jgi:hypothetical protein